jgi:hypothetical protein
MFLHQYFQAISEGLLCSGYRDCFPEGREVDHSPPSTADVKNEWSCTSAPTYAFVAWIGKTIPLSFRVKYGEYNVITFMQWNVIRSLKALSTQK